MVSKPVPIIAYVLDVEAETNKLKRLVGETQEAFLFRKKAFEKILSHGDYDLRESTMYAKMITNFVYKGSLPTNMDKMIMEKVIKDCEIELA